MAVFRLVNFIFFFKQKTAYEVLISDWSSDVCSSDLDHGRAAPRAVRVPATAGGDRGTDVARTSRGTLRIPPVATLSLPRKHQPPVVTLEEETPHDSG